MNITTASKSNLKSCLPILLDSVLGTYFEADLATSILLAGYKNNELFVALQGTDVVGFYLVAKKGAFLVFPYLHLLVVKTSERRKSIGKLLLDHFETTVMEIDGYPFRQKAFLLVSEENKDAIRFYETCGYVKKASFDNMFGEGDTEVLMMNDLGFKTSDKKSSLKTV
jgi:ribosomal protein S18 acetylase RimI-like enzyme